MWTGALARLNANQSPRLLKTFIDRVTSMPTLADRNCVPCKGGVPPLKGEELEKIRKQLTEPEKWKINGEHHLLRSFKFPDFKSALAFVNRVGAIAEEQGHHPDINLAWGKVEITIWTHAIDGLTESDFILAAKIEQINSEKL